jgi:P4 family phage/plasmid primase-like protien
VPIGKTMLKNNKILQNISNSAIEWVNAGFIVIPAEISNKVKKPLVKFADIRHELTPKHSLDWLKQFPNATALATITDNGLFVLDADTPESLSALYKLESEYQVSPNLVILTRNGEHHYFRISDDINATARGFDGSKHPNKIDIKTGKSMVILPPSQRDGEIAYSIKYFAINTVDDLGYVEQRFVDAVFRHNQDPLPTVTNTTTKNVEKWNGEELEVHKAKVILSYIDPDLPYEDWMKVMFGIVSKFGKTMEAVTLIDEWSSAGSSYKGLSEICYKISTIKGNGGITFATVYHLSNVNEADLLFISQVNCKQALAYSSFEIALEALRLNPKDGVAFDQAVYHITTSDALTAEKQCERLKSLSGVTLAIIRSEVKKAKHKVPLTHSQIADKVIDEFLGVKPIGEFGMIWQYNEDSGIWKSSSHEDLVTKIGSRYTSEPLCIRLSDYKAIALLVYNNLKVNGFFESAPKGIQTALGFHCIREYRLIVLQKAPEHRARFKLDFVPDDKSIATEFIGFLERAFGESHQQQIFSLKIMLGLALLGIQNDHQIACLLFGVGGSGKSTFLKIIQALVPSDYITHISPFDMDKDYNKASLGGKLLNIVPEMDKDKPIPSADFKSIVGGDTINARNLYGQPFSVKPEAGNWFNSNFFPCTKDQSDAFFRRWYIFHFMHSTPQGEQDPNLVSRIIANEMPSILAFAFEGIGIYLISGRQLYLSDEHKKCKEKWRNDSNSVKTWLSDDECELLNRAANQKSMLPVRKSFAYRSYVNWCKSNNRRPYSNQVFIGFMEELGHVATQYNGNAVYKTLYVNPFEPPISTLNFVA